jgi:hypothetical protein
MERRTWPKDLEQGPTYSPNGGMPASNPPELQLAPFAIDCIDRRIAPTLEQVITLPVLVNGHDSGISVYVAVSAFAPRVSDGSLKLLATVIADLVNNPGVR